MVPFLKICLILTTFYPYSHSFPGQSFSGSAQKLIKIKESQHAKTVLVMKKVAISSSSAKQQWPDVVEEKSEEHAYGEQNCPDPFPQPLQDHQDFVRSLLSRKVYLPMAHSFFYDKLSFFLTGKLFDYNGNNGDACYRIQNSIEKRHYYGFGEHRSVPCDTMHDLLDTTCYCTLLETPIKMHVVAAWSDGSTMVLMVGCNSDKGGWAVASNQPKIDDATRKIVRQKIAELGFDSSEVAELSYDNCDQEEESGEITVDVPLKCIEPHPRPLKDHQEIARALVHKRLYVPMAINGYLDRISLGVTGRFLEDNDSSQACMRGKITNNQKQFFAFGSHVTVDCDTITDALDTTCHWNYNGKLIHIHSTAVWTDGSTMVLLVSCSSEGGGWAVASTEPKVTEAKKQLVRQKLTELGFNSKNVAEISYEKCDEEENVDSETCPEPHPEPMGNHQEFARTLLSYRVFVPMASAFSYDIFSKHLSGKPLNKDNEAQACIRIINEKNARRFFGFGRHHTVECDTMDDYLDTICHCNATGIPFPFRTTAVWSDGSTVALLVGCAGEKGLWALVSNQRQIGEATKKIVHKKVIELGFDERAIEELSYDHCEKAVPDDIAEGTCTVVDTLESRSKNHVLHVLEQGVYTPMSSVAHVHALGTFLTGKTISGGLDKKTFCASDHWGLHGTLTSRGFNHHKGILGCDLNDIRDILCEPDEEHEENQNLSYIYNKQLQPVWTDGRQYVLAYVCWSVNLRTWALYSTVDHVDNHTREFVTGKITADGFDPKKVSINNYGTCGSHEIPTDETDD